MWRRKNITLNSKILTAHFTGKEKTITLCSVILILSFANITLCLSNSFSSNSVFALSYESEVGIGFTFNPTISISLSSSDLTIPNLTPGTTSESNSINISVATNAAYGYTLSATVGNNTYNNSNLNHSNNTDIFSSIATNANLANLDTDNTWGYSTSLDNGSNWSNYNGLSSVSAQLADTNHLAEDTINFKIATKASNTQPSGTYTNTINFIAIAKPTPQVITDLEYLQDFAHISATDLNNVKGSMPIHSTFTLKDQRDGQEYTIAKLNDSKIWMTKNLNLAGGIEITAELSDVSENYMLPTTNGFLEGNRLPESSTDFNNDTKAFVYNSNNETNNCSGLGCYSYYSWVAATAGSGVNISIDGDNAPNSICPKGWHLPTSGTNGNSDFGKLVELYQNFYSTAGPGTTANFLLGGYIYYGNFRVTGSTGYYWSSTAGETGYAYRMYFYNGSTANTSYLRQGGMSVRCLAK